MYRTKKIIVFGSGPHANVVIDVIQSLKDYEFGGIVTKTPRDLSSSIEHLVVGHDHGLNTFISDFDGGVIGIGDNNIRRTVASRILEITDNFEFPTLFHPSSVIGRGVVIGAGSVVMAGAVINTRSRVGAHCVINSNATIEHDCSIGDFVSIAPAACLAGGVRIGSGVSINIGANVAPGVSIGEYSVVGAGSTVLGDIPARVVAFGTPARIIRSC